MCCGGNDKYGHQCLSALNHCYLQCPKCNKTYRLCGIYNTLSDYLEKVKEKSINLKKVISELKEEKENNLNDFNSKKKILEERVKELENHFKNKNDKK